MSKTAVYTLTEIRNKIYAKSREKERAGEWFLPQVLVADEVIEWIDEEIAENDGMRDDDYDFITSGS
jgi:hypothetical protein